MTGGLQALVSVGSDEMVGGGAKFALITTAAAGVASGLTSKGDAIKIFSDGTTLTGFADSGTAGFDAGDRKVFTLTVGADGTYTFTLLDQVDHLRVVQGENLLGTALDLFVLHHRRGFRRRQAGSERRRVHGPDPGQCAGDWFGSNSWIRALSNGSQNDVQLRYLAAALWSRQNLPGADAITIAFGAAPTGYTYQAAETSEQLMAIPSP